MKISILETTNPSEIAHQKELQRRKRVSMNLTGKNLRRGARLKRLEIGDTTNRVDQRMQDVQGYDDEEEGEIEQ